MILLEKSKRLRLTVFCGRLKLTKKKKITMPIRPENKSRYPKNWKQIRQQILERAGNRCEFCGVENHSEVPRYRSGRGVIMVKVVLTIAHLDHTPENCDPSNLRALCQKCHNSYDAKHRAETRQKTLMEKIKRRGDET